MLVNDKRGDLKNLCPEWRKHRNKFQTKRMNKKIRQRIQKEIRQDENSGL